jgi:hypothetical protein
MSPLTGVEGLRNVTGATLTSRDITKPGEGCGEMEPAAGIRLASSVVVPLVRKLFVTEDRAPDCSTTPCGYRATSPSGARNAR